MGLNANSRYRASMKETLLQKITSPLRIPAPGETWGILEKVKREVKREIKREVKREIKREIKREVKREVKRERDQTCCVC